MKLKILVMLFVLFWLASGLVSCMPDGTIEAGESKNALTGSVYRVIDHELNIVCYYKATSSGGISCLPIP